MRTSAQRMVAAAKLFVGDDDGPLDPQEEAIIAEQRRTLPRPTSEEIKTLGRRLAQAQT
jgi:hypothetical protein